MKYTDSLNKLLHHLEKLPGVGPKTAQRLAFHLMKAPIKDVNDLGNSILEVREKTKICKICFNFSEIDPCHVCADTNRDQKIICVVEEPNDMIFVEQSGKFTGLYHILMGTISPPDGIEPQHLRISELVSRVKNGDVEEVILATNPNMRGDATALYILGQLKPLGIKITRIASGIPVGGDLEYMDKVTISKSIEGRQEV